MLGTINKYLRVFTLAALACGTAMVPAYAQSVSQTENVEHSGSFDFDDLDYIGDIGDYAAYSVDDIEGLWLISSDGKTIINGIVYDLSGDELKVNFEPKQMEDMPDFLSHSEEAGSTGSHTPPVALTSEYGGLDMDVVDASLKDLGQDEKNELVADLVTRMNSAQSPEEFQLLVREWQANLQGDKQAAFLARKGLSILRGEDVPSAQITETDHAMTQTLPDVSIQMPTPEAVVTEASHQQTSASMSDDEYLFNQMREEGFWIPMGKQGAPVAYMFVDPSCPYCARSFQNMAPDIAAGKLQLRVLLVPAISKSSAGKIAAILTSDNPVSTIMQHELQYAERGASDLRPVDFSVLSQEMNDKIRKNYDILIDNGLPGVPFFAYQTDEGIKFLSGVAKTGQFSHALPE